MQADVPSDDWLIAVLDGEQVFIGPADEEELVFSQRPAERRLRRANPPSRGPCSDIPNIRVQHRRDGTVEVLVPPPQSREPRVRRVFWPRPARYDLRSADPYPMPAREQPPLVQRVGPTRVTSAQRGAWLETTFKLHCGCTARHKTNSLDPAELAMVGLARSRSADHHTCRSFDLRDRVHRLQDADRRHDLLCRQRNEFSGLQDGLQIGGA